MRRYLFIFRRIMMGDSYAMACYRWYLYCLDQATRAQLGRPMGHYNAPRSK